MIKSESSIRTILLESSEPINDLLNWWTFITGCSWMTSEIFWHFLLNSLLHFYVQSNSRDPKIVAVVDKWSLFRGHSYSKSPIWNFKMLPVIDKWSLVQVWLYLGLYTLGCDIFYGRPHIDTYLNICHLDTSSPQKGHLHMRIAILAKEPQYPLQYLVFVNTFPTPSFTKCRRYEYDVTI